MMQRVLLVSLLAILSVSLAGLGCTPDIGPGTQLAGQECTSDDDCIDDLLCVERRCRPVGDDSTDDADAGDDTGIDTDHDTADDGDSQ